MNIPINQDIESNQSSYIQLRSRLKQEQSTQCLFDPKGSKDDAEYNLLRQTYYTQMHESLLGFKPQVNAELFEKAEIVFESVAEKFLDNFFSSAHAIFPDIVSVQVTYEPSLVFYLSFPNDYKLYLEEYFSIGDESDTYTYTGLRKNETQLASFDNGMPRALKTIAQIISTKSENHRSIKLTTLTNAAC
jgi:hypothetical protein